MIFAFEKVKLINLYNKKAMFYYILTKSENSNVFVNKYFVRIENK